MSIITRDTKILTYINKLSVDEIDVELPIEHLRTWGNWTMHNNKFYYFKPFNLNELIGQYLCKMIDLKSVYNHLAIKKSFFHNKLYLVTENFLQQNKHYEHASYTLFTNLQAKCLDEDNYQKLVKDHLLLFALDIFMRQLDRGTAFNLMYEINEENYYSLAPVYDFSKAFFNINNYETPYFNLNLNKKKTNKNTISIEDFYSSYPEFYSMLKFYLDIDLSEIIYLIAHDYYLDIHYNTIKKYQKKEYKSKELIKSLL